MFLFFFFFFVVPFREIMIETCTVLCSSFENNISNSPLLSGIPVNFDLSLAELYLFKR